MVRITALMDNLGSEQKLLVHEHGLSYLLEGPRWRILFDCGGSGHPWDNARMLGRDVSGLDAVVLSHSHYDHSGGYRFLIEGGQGSSVLYTGPGFFEPKFAWDGLRYTDLSAGFDRAFLEQHHITHREVRGAQEIFSGVWLVSGFPRVHSFETIPKRFVRQTGNGFVQDDFSDEQCLVLDLNGKLYVFVGCSHPGILNMITQVHTLLGKPIAAVFGGTHLVEADEERIHATVKELSGMGLHTLGLSHCSGGAAEEKAREHSGVTACHLAAGDCLFLGE